MFYIEVGAHDGVFQSQTLKLEKEGWNGLLIEANPILFDKCKKNRGSNNIFVNACLVNNDYKKETIPFYSYDNIGAMGRTEKYFINESVKGTKFSVPAKPINHILKEHNITTVDFFSIDTEGAEIEILNSIDFDQVNYKSFLIEFHGSNSVDNTTKENKIKLANQKLTKLGYHSKMMPCNQVHILYSK